MTKETDVREVTLDILTEVLEEGGYSHLILRQALNKYQFLQKPERAFISRVTDGTIEYLLQLDYIINTYSTVKVNKMKPLIRTLLRMSVYQIFYMDRIPDSAVCNEAVKLAQKRKFSGLKGFVNGVLRNISRNKAQIVFPNDSIRYSMPEWIISMWRERYQEETVRAILGAFLENSRTAVRFHFNKAPAAEILDSLKAQGVTAAESSISSIVYYLENYDYLESLTAFQKGWIQVQDLSSSLVGLAAAPKAGDKVLDVCGAPGGKSLHLADLLRGTGHVTVRDLTEQKVALIQENIDRTGFSNISAGVGDALIFDPQWEEQADIVIADLPCSGLGIIGRKPDIKYRMTREQLTALASLQREILSVVWKYVKPGGTLVYSTCTINPMENEDNGAWFINEFPFKRMNIEGRLGDKLKAESLSEGYIQLLPGIHPCDGFFLSVFTRTV